MPDGWFECCIGPKNPSKFALGDKNVPSIKELLGNWTVHIVFGDWLCKSFWDFEREQSVRAVTIVRSLHSGKWTKSARKIKADKQNMTENYAKDPVFQSNRVFFITVGG